MILPPRDNVKTVLAIHQQESATRIVVGAIRSGGGGDVDLRISETISLAAGPAALTSIVERAGSVDLVIRVLPPALTVARISALPESDPASGVQSSPAAIADALALIAESELPAAIPGYRRAAGLINPGKGVDRKSVGLLTAWPQTAEAYSAGATRPPRIAPDVSISEAAALAVLAQVVGGVERAWTFDRTGGAMTILAAGPDKTVVRVARLAASADSAARTKAIDETSRAAGLAPGETRADDSAWVQLRPQPANPRIGGAGRSADWVAQYGLAAAAIVAYADPSPAVSALVALHEVEPKAKPAILQRVSGWLGSPMRAAAVIAICVIACLGLTVGAAYAKVRLLSSHVKDQTELQARNEQDEKELVFARTLREKRWPMTKLLADICASCPVGVTIDAVEIGQGDGVVLRGVAADADKLTTFRENLRSTKIFTDPTTPTTSQVAAGVQFQLLAKITGANALYNAKPIDDFASNTLFKRMYPEATSRSPGRTNTTRDRATSRNDRTDRRATSNGNRPSTPSRDSGRDSGRTTTPSASKQPVVIPDPISDAEIARLSFEGAMKEFSVRKKASAQAGLDEATKRRLTDEYEKARARMKQANSGGGS